MQINTYHKHDNAPNNHPNINLPSTTAALIAIFPAMLGIFWLTAVACTIAHEYQHEYARVMNLRKNEAWLFEQCQNDEFYHNLKEHSSLCDQISAQHETKPSLDAMATVLQNTRLCGYYSCTDLFMQITQWIADRSVVFFIGCLLLIFLIPSILQPFWRSYQVKLADHYMATHYNTPYGVQRYVQSHPLYSVKKD